MIAGVVGRVARLTRATVPDQVYVAVRPRLEKILGLQEPELAHLLQARAKPWGRRFVDVGANWGSYTVLLGSKFARVESFEPLSHCAAALRRYAAAFKANIEVHEYALSDREETVSFLVPENDSVDRSRTSRIVDSIEASSIPVEAKTLDSFRFDDVDLVKIDVEGHERRVIAGAAGTIRRCRPALLVEIEQRQFSEPLAERIAYVESFGYRASFWRDGKKTDAAEFVVERDQNLANFDKRGRYINNFLFEPVAPS
jgi:FkbM family methyltransferase